MSFWQLAFNNGWVTADQLKQVVITETNLKGEITPEEYKTITGVDYVA